MLCWFSNVILFFFEEKNTLNLRVLSVFSAFSVYKICIPLLYCSWSDKTQDSERWLSYLPKRTELFL